MRLEIFHKFKKIYEELLFNEQLFLWYLILCIIDGLIKSHWFQPKPPLSSPLCRSPRGCPKSIRSRSCFPAPGTSGNPDCKVCLFIRGFQCLALGPSAGWISSRGCSPSGRSRSTPSSILELSCSRRSAGSLSAPNMTLLFPSTGSRSSQSACPKALPLGLRSSRRSRLPSR